VNLGATEDAGSALINSPAISSLPERTVESGLVLKQAHAAVLSQDNLRGVYEGSTKLSSRVTQSQDP
jgi:hypothetical protein